MAVHPNQLVHFSGGECLEKYGTLIKSPVLPTRQVDPTFARSHASSAVSGLYSASPDAIHRKAEADVPRVVHLDLDGDGDYTDLALRLEAERTNLILQSADFSTTWATSNASVSGSSVTSPDGGTNAQKINDDSASQFGRIRQSLTVADDSNEHVFSLYIAKSSFAGTSDICQMRLDYTGGTGINGSVRLDPADGSTNNAGDVTDAWVEEVGDFWRVTLVVANNGSGNTNLNVDFLPSVESTLGGGTDVSLQGQKTIWGAQVEKAAFPSTYIPTTTASVTRNEETFQAPYHVAADQDITIYAHLKERGTGSRAANFTRLIQIGDAAGNDPRLRIYGDGNEYRCQVLNAAGSSVVSSDGGPNPDLLDEVEVRAVLTFSGGNVTAQVWTALSGGSESSPGASSSLAVDFTAWSGALIHLNGTSASSPGLNDFRAVKVATSAHSMSAMREAY